jgi:hypothetical protein
LARLASASCGQVRLRKVVQTLPRLPQVSWAPVVIRIGVVWSVSAMKRLANLSCVSGTASCGGVCLGSFWSIPSRGWHPLVVKSRCRPRPVAMTRRFESCLGALDALRNGKVPSPKVGSASAGRGSDRCSSESYGSDHLAVACSGSVRRRTFRDFMWYGLLTYAKVGVGIA